MVYLFVQIKLILFHLFVTLLRRYLTKSTQSKWKYKK